jgi:hypothetical protein
VVPASMRVRVPIERSARTASCACVSPRGGLPERPPSLAELLGELVPKLLWS